MKTFINSHVFSSQSAKRVCKGMLLVLLSMVFLFSCKQAKKTKEAPKNLVVTLKSDSNVCLKEGESSVTVLEGSKWRDVYSKFKDIIEGYKEGWEEGGFRLDDANGEELARYSDYEFRKDASVFVFAKREQVSVYVTVDDGYILLGDSSIRVGRFSLWNEIRDRVESLVQLKDDYNKDCWKVLGEIDAIADNAQFASSSTTLMACSKIKDEKDPNKVTLTVSANEGFDVASPNTLRCSKDDRWMEIKDKAFSMLTLKKDYIFVEWRKGGKDGDVLDDTLSFDSDEIVFAVAKKEECSLSIINGEGYNIKNAEVFKIEKNSLWKDVKESVEARIEVLDEYKVVEWRVNAKDGDVLEDTYQFSSIDKIIYLYPICKKKNIKITLRVDAGIILKDSDVFLMPNPSNWKDIKKEALGKIKLREYYDFVSWHMSDEEGDELKDESKIFSQDMMIFAKSKRQQINITVQGGAGCNIVDGSLRVFRGTLWKDIEHLAKNKLGLDEEFYEIESWKLDNQDGALLVADYQFLSDKVVYAYTKHIEVLIHIKGGEGYHLKDSSNDCITVAKGDVWQNVKDEAINMIVIEEDFDFVAWKMEDGSPLVDDQKINEGFSVIAITKLKDIEITVEADEGFYFNGNNIIRVPIRSKWKDIQTDAESKVTLKDYWTFSNWRADSVNGIVLYEDYTFMEDTSIFATSIREDVEIIVQADEGYILISNVPITVPRGTTWKEVYVIAKGYVRLKEGYKASKWKKDNPRGITLRDHHVFENNTTHIYATSRKKV